MIYGHLNSYVTNSTKMFLCAFCFYASSIFLYQYLLHNLFSLGLAYFLHFTL